MGGGGSTYDYGFRIYNPALGKFLSVDPLFTAYPWYTPYQFAGNNPIAAIDVDGLEPNKKLNETEQPSSGAVTAGVKKGATTFGMGILSNLTFPMLVVNLYGTVKKAANGDGVALAGLLSFTVSSYAEGNEVFSKGNTVDKAAFVTEKTLTIGTLVVPELLAGKVPPVSSLRVATEVSVATEQTSVIATANNGVVLSSKGVSVAPTSLVELGPYAGESIPAVNGTSRKFTTAERGQINQIGSQTGCHTCGTTNAGTKSGNFVLDHYPHNDAVSLGQDYRPQRLYPHCSTCSARQGGNVTAVKAVAKRVNGAVGTW